VLLLYQFLLGLAPSSHHSDFMNLVVGSKAIYNTINQTADMYRLVLRTDSDDEDGRFLKSDTMTNSEDVGRFEWIELNSRISMR
jgi:hypothetical protein